MASLGFGAVGAGMAQGFEDLLARKLQEEQVRAQIAHAEALSRQGQQEQDRLAGAQQFHQNVEFPTDVRFREGDAARADKGLGIQQGHLDARFRGLRQAADEFNQQQTLREQELNEVTIPGAQSAIALRSTQGDLNRARTDEANLGIPPATVAAIHQLVADNRDDIVGARRVFNDTILSQITDPQMGALLNQEFLNAQSSLAAPTLSRAGAGDMSLLEAFQRSRDGGAPPRPAFSTNQPRGEFTTPGGFVVRKR